MKLPTKKDKTAKKPKWQSKIGGKKAKDAELVETPEEVVETPVQEEPALPPEPTEVPVVATTPETASVEQTTMDEVAMSPDAEVTAEPITPDPFHRRPRPQEAPQAQGQSQRTAQET